MAKHLGLDLGGADAEALGFDHVVGAGDEVDEAVLVFVDLVAAEDQRLARKAAVRPERLGRVLGIVPIALGDGGAALHQFANDLRRALVAVLVEHQDLAVGDGAADRGGKASSLSGGR